MVRLSGFSRLSFAAVAVLTASIALAGCSPDSFSPGPSSAELSGTLSVYAAASLTAPFDELLGEFARDHEGLNIHSLVSDGSPTLATQIAQGAPADVFASADEATMDSLSGVQAAAPRVFATNTLEIAVQSGNPRHIADLGDLADPGLQVVVCAPTVPCGAAAHRLLERDSIAVTPVSEEQNVTAVLTKVKLGEADAGLVYVTDVLASAGSVTGVPIADAASALNHYPIAAMTTGTNPRAAAAFVEFVLSPRGQAVLAKYGFGAP